MHCEEEITLCFYCAGEESQSTGLQVWSTSPPSHLGRTGGTWTKITQNKPTMSFHPVDFPLGASGPAPSLLCPQPLNKRHNLYQLNRDIKNTLFSDSYYALQLFFYDFHTLFLSIHSSFDCML